MENLITKPEVERKLLERLHKKAAAYAQDFELNGDAQVNANAKIDVDGVVEFYETFIIPLTKEVEVDIQVLTIIGIETLIRWTTCYNDWMA